MTAAPNPEPLSDDAAQRLFEWLMGEPDRDEHPDTDPPTERTP